MNKSTILLVTLAALILGVLIGIGTAVKNSPETPVEGSSAMSEAAAAGGQGTETEGPVFRYLTPDDVEITYDDFGRAAPSTLGENRVSVDRPFKTETLEITIEPLAEIEYKALMQQGDAIVYSWSTDGGEVYYDFHAHDAAFGDEFFTRYAEGEGISDSGMILAPYSGQHGWYWLSLEDEPIRVTLKVSGFFDEIIEIDLEAY